MASPCRRMKVQGPESRMPPAWRMVSQGHSAEEVRCQNPGRQWAGRTDRHPCHRSPSPWLRTRQVPVQRCRLPAAHSIRRAGGGNSPTLRSARPVSGRWVRPVHERCSPQGELWARSVDPLSSVDTLRSVQQLLPGREVGHGSEILIRVLPKDVAGCGIQQQDPRGIRDAARDQAAGK